MTGSYPGLAPNRILTQTLVDKPPPAGIATDWDAFDACLTAARGQPRCVLKIAVFDDPDYNYAQAVAARYPVLPVDTAASN